MRMIVTIFKKEFIYTLRDHRTLLVMVLFPLLLLPILISISSKVMIAQVKKAHSMVLKVGLVSSGNTRQFREMLLERSDLDVVENIMVEAADSLIQNDCLDGIFIFSADFDSQIAKNQSGKIDIFLKSTEESGITQKRLLELVKDYERVLLAQRLKQFNLNESIIKPININVVNLATLKQRIWQKVGSVFPMLFIIFCFTGSMYPAIDLGAGEKERGTMETLLTSPANRFEIILGKFGVVFLSGIISAVIAMVGLYIGVRQIQEIPKELLDLIIGLFEVKDIVLVFSLLVPLSIFFSAILLAISIFAKSFKEAQNIMTTFMMVMLLPIFISSLPGFTLNPKTALIPILNVALALNSIISGKIVFGLFLKVFLSMFLLAGISLAGCSCWFEKESTIFRI